MLILTNRVRVNGIRVELTIAVCALYQAASKSPRDWYITSMKDGTHSNASLHYVGFAIDCDVVGKCEVAEIDRFELDLRCGLTPEFDLIRETKDGKFSHFHIEFQPKLSNEDRIRA